MLLTLEESFDGGAPSLNGSLSISYSLLAPAIVLFLLFVPAPPPPRLPNSGSGSYVALAGWNELKKSSPPKSMSSFFALSFLLTSCFLANEMPPPGAAAAAYIAGGCFLPSYMLPEAAVVLDVFCELTGTLMAWKVACGAGSFTILSCANVLFVC